MYFYTYKFVWAYSLQDHIWPFYSIIAIPFQLFVLPNIFACINKSLTLFMIASGDNKMFDCENSLFTGDGYSRLFVPLFSLVLLLLLFLLLFLPIFCCSWCTLYTVYSMLCSKNTDWFWVRKALLCSLVFACGTESVDGNPYLSPGLKMCFCLRLINDWSVWINFPVDRLWVIKIWFYW